MTFLMLPWNLRGYGGYQTGPEASYGAHLHVGSIGTGSLGGDGNA